MTIDTNAAPGAAASTAAPAFPANDSEGLADPANPTGEQPGENESAPESEHDKARRKLERRVGTVTRQRYEAEARANQNADRAARAEAELERLRQERSQPPGDGTTQGDPQGRRDQQQTRAPSREEIDQHVNQRAAELHAVTEATRRGNEIADAGRKAFGDSFVESVHALQDEAGPLYQRNGLPTALGEAIHDADNPAALLNHLGQNPDDAAELRGLGPAALGRRIAKLEAQIAAAPAPQSQPVHRPVQGSATARSKSPSDMTDAEWDAQRRAKRK